MISEFKNLTLHKINKIKKKKKVTDFTLCRYTLGGFFLASYDDSPAGIFDEVVYYYWFMKLMNQYLVIT